MMILIKGKEMLTLTRSKQIISFMRSTVFNNIPVSGDLF